MLLIMLFNKSICVVNCAVYVCNEIQNLVVVLQVLQVLEKVTALSVNEPSLPRFAFICSIGVTEPDSRSRSRHYLRHLHCAVSSFTPSSAISLCRWYVVRASNTRTRILPYNSTSLQAHLPLGCLYQPKTRMRHLLRNSSGKYSDSEIFFIREDIFDLLVICMPSVSPFPIARMSKIWNKSFFLLVKAL